ncbi:TonB system transport protein ExbD [Caulobacter radicis]|uniref:TonB system transport protein ExbD n=1 Tax=Caulobacter radicis TaxID=2172650 RepID=UPI000D587B81|nr:TonB system transport protein ExbD [Caulobacter radicis]PVM84512.1 TonB system transport protein ExbD [Caulobacter radicis]
MGAQLDEDDEFADVSDINVTPFIDVMLVLLIIFMVAAPLATVDVPVELPSSSGAEPAPQAEPVYVTLQKDLSISVGEASVSEEDLATALDRATKNDTKVRILVRADRTVSYGDLMRLMGLIGRSGYLKVALVGVGEGGGVRPVR